MKYEYKCTIPDLPPNATSPIMDCSQMTTWLNNMSTKGWEFVGYGCTNWNSGLTQDWWIFRKEKP